MLHHQYCLYRMEARIEAVEEELRQEKQKNASLRQQSQMPLHSISAGSYQDNLATVSQSILGKKAKTTSSGGSGDSLKAQVELKKRSRQGGLEVNNICIPDFTLTLLYSEEKEQERKRSKKEDCEDLPVTPVKWDPDIVIEEWSSGSSDSDIVIEEVQDADNKENSIPYDV